MMTFVKLQETPVQFTEVAGTAIVGWFDLLTGLEMESTNAKFEALPCGPTTLAPKVQPCHPASCKCGAEDWASTCRFGMLWMRWFPTMGYQCARRHLSCLTCPPCISGAYSRTVAIWLFGLPRKTSVPILHERQTEGSKRIHRFRFDVTPKPSASIH